MREDDPLLADVAEVVAREPSTPEDADAPMPWLGRLCRAASRDLEASGAAVSLMVREGPTASRSVPTR